MDVRVFSSFCGSWMILCVTKEFVLFLFRLINEVMN